MVSRASNFPPEFFPAEIIIPGKDESETGIPVNLRHGNSENFFRRKNSGSGGNFSAFRRKYPWRKFTGIYSLQSSLKNMTLTWIENSTLIQLWSRVLNYSFHLNTWLQLELKTWLKLDFNLTLNSTF